MGKGPSPKFSLGPFDSVAFEALAEGLEVSVVRLSEVTSDNPTMRVDSSYFSKSGLAAETTLRAGNYETIADVSASVLSFGAYALTNQVIYQDAGIPFLRCADIKNGFVSFGDTLFIDEAANQLLHKSQVEPETVLLTMSGSVGSTAVALPNWDYPINSNQDVAKIKAASIDPYYLAAFLGSRLGQAQIERMPVGSVQQHIFLSMIERVLVARLSDSTEAEIGRLLQAAFDLQAEATAQLAQAEADLLDALGLAGWSPPEPLTHTRSATDVVAAGRLDAAYFAPKHDEVLARLAATRAARLLGDNDDAIVVRGAQPNYKYEGMPVVNSKHVRRNHVIMDDSNRLATAGRIVIESGDVLVNGTGVGTIGRAAPYMHDKSAIPDNHVTVIRSVGVDPIYLSLFLNSPIGQSQIERAISGSSGQIEIYPADLKNIVIWSAPEATQAALAESVKQSFASEVMAKRLLATARRAVEIAIEAGEAAALRFIESEGA